MVCRFSLFGTTKNQERNGRVDQALVCGFPDGGEIAETSVATSADIHEGRTCRILAALCLASLELLFCQGRRALMTPFE